MLAQTHRFIIQHALQFRRKHFKGYEKEIINACAKEDIPRLALDKKEFQLFGLDHFYNPKLKKGYSRFASNAKEKGIYLFRKAVKLYKQGKKQQAFNNLGRCCHYLQDVASPAHTKLILHMEEDDFERYVNQNIHKLNFKIRTRVIPPLRISHCFDIVARRSYRVEYKKHNYFLGSVLRLFFRIKQKDPEKKLNKISKRLVKLSIIYTIVLLNAFNRRIIRYNFMQKQKQLRDKFIQEEKKLVKKIKQKSKDLVS